MSDEARKRQELYDRIRKSSREEVILEEMIRLGFWPAQGELPEDPAEEIRQRGQIRKELQELRSRNRALQNEAALKKRFLQERLAESRRKQQETRERRERERQDRAAAWKERQQQEVLYLGEGVSGGLTQKESKADRLQAYQLPLLHSPEQLAAAMGITVGELRFLAFARRTSTISHYVRFKIAKKTGGSD